MAMDLSMPAPPLPAQYYRRHAARVRQLAQDATTAAVKDNLRDIALEYERLAERADAAILGAGRPDDGGA
jgi:hypothetical protein